MRRAILLLAMTTATLLLASGVALAAVLTGTDGPDAVEGTVSDDLVYTDGTDSIADDCEKIILGPHLDAWDVSPYQPIQFRE